jgi:EpsI family protein
LRYLIASVTLGFLYAYVMYRSIGRRIIFIIAAAIVPIFANGIRAYMVVMIGYLSDMRLAVGIDHIIYGWVLFGIIIGIMFYVGSFWREDTEGHLGGGRMGSSQEAGLEHPSQTGKLVMATLSVMALMLLWPALAVKVDGASRSVVPIKLDTPMPAGGWSLAGLRWDWQPSYLKPQGSLRQSYASQRGVVSLYLEYYRDQRQGAELVDSQNLLVGVKDPVWRLLSNKKTVAQLDGRPITVREASIDSPSDKLLVWQWYWIDGYPTTNDYLAKLFEAKDKLYEGRTRSASIILATDYEVHADRARKKLAQFINDMYPEIEKTLLKENAASGNTVRSSNAIDKQATTNN